MESKTCQVQTENVDLSRKMKRSRSLECLEELRELIKQRESSENKEGNILHHFQWLLEDDKFLYHFIRGCKYSTTNAFSKMQMYFKQRLIHAEFVQQIIPSQMTEVCKVLRQRGPDGQFIVLQKASDWDTTKLSADEYLISCIGNQEVVWEDELTEKHGVIGIWDTSGYGLSHLKNMSPRFVAKILQLTYNAFPMRVKAVYVVNAPVYFIAMYSAAKYLFPKKFRERFFIHGKNHDILFSLVPPEKLPVCIGGSASDSEAYREDIFPAVLAKENYYIKFGNTIRNIAEERNTQNN